MCKINFDYQVLHENSKKKPLGKENLQRQDSDIV